MSDQLVSETATFTTNNKQRRKTYMPSAGFESAIEVIKRLYTYAVDRTATAVGEVVFVFVFVCAVVL